MDIVRDYSEIANNSKEKTDIDDLIFGDSPVTDKQSTK